MWTFEMAGNYHRKIVLSIFLVSIVGFLWLVLKCDDGSSIMTMAASIWDTKSKISFVDWSKVKPRKKVSEEDLHDKWIVVTSVSLPTEQVKKLSVIDGWRLIIVADLKTPKDWSHPNVVFLSVEKQKELGYKTTSLLPYKNYARKNIGYLYAIEHGAKIIYETDDDNYPYDGKIGFGLDGEKKYLVYATDRATVNPYEHFGQSTIWPRGYPLENIGDPVQRTFVKCDNIQPLIRQGVVNGDPDVDAIFRLTRKDVGVKLDVEFDSKAPPVLIPPGTYTPFNCQNTVYLYNAFWGLVLPPSQTLRVTDIWRSFYVKRLLQEIDGYLGFFGPSAYQERNSHSYLEDFIDEKALYYNAGRFIEFLRKWKPTKLDFFSQILELTIALVNENFLEPIDALIMKAWLTDLVSMGYVIPQLRTQKAPCAKIIENEKVKTYEEKPSSFIHLGKQLKNIYKL
ncbi:probable glycosyltransferase STELLO1 [Xenia sp. Carnegie-2017]|uniref:probable glycosyltransferase STELLO1 n=1 Tax=Xenia sp. Carnegie-2017 TaxID=2897299 RepID=UPI001F03A6E8|nr:probable glycosyltransferase STELLO1 [Xenia sp. Carnegie-2017]